ncbi:hypothetical protein BDQ17DRAFT_1260160, partial [Cyathus striatus]
DPAPDVAVLNTIFDRLSMNDVKLNNFIRSMILLMAIPNKWDNIASTILATTAKDNLKVTTITSTLSAEHARQTTGSQRTQKASAIKCKQSNPHWNQQKQNDGNQNSSGNSGNSSGNRPNQKKNRCNTRGGKNQCNGNGNPHTHSHDHGHSHVASVALTPSVEPSPTLLERLSDPSSTVFKRVHGTPAQAFQGEKKSQDTYPVYKQA